MISSGRSPKSGFKDFPFGNVSVDGMRNASGIALPSFSWRRLQPGAHQKAEEHVSGPHFDISQQCPRLPRFQETDWSSALHLSHNNS
jgi:hypothetical protein